MKMIIKKLDKKRRYRLYELMKFRGLNSVYFEFTNAIITKENSRDFDFIAKVKGSDKIFHRKIISKGWEKQFENVMEELKSEIMIIGNKEKLY